MFVDQSVGLAITLPEGNEKGAAAHA
jgi:hypothetical protein